LGEAIDPVAIEWRPQSVRIGTSPIFDGVIDPVAIEWRPQKCGCEQLI